MVVQNDHYDKYGRSIQKVWHLHKETLFSEGDGTAFVRISRIVFKKKSESDPHKNKSGRNK